MPFHTVFELHDFAQRFIDCGLGFCQPVLDRRGCDCSQSPTEIGDPGDGERVSQDGTKVYLTCRKTEP